MLMVPAPTTAPPSAEDTVPPAAAVPQEGRDWANGDDSAQNGNRVQLRDTLVTDAVSNRARLREALDKAPERARDALRRALEVSEDGYEEALEALE
jgi:hypothetical protein